MIAGMEWIVNASWRLVYSAPPVTLENAAKSMNVSVATMEHAATALKEGGRSSSF